MPLASLTRLLAACLFALCAALPASAQPAAGGRALATCVLRDTGGMNPATLIRQPERFDCSTPQYAFGSGDYWVISSDIGQRSRSRQPLNVRIASLWQGGLDLYALYSDGQVDSFSSDRRGVTPFIQLGALVEHPLPRHTAEVVRVMWHVRGAPNMRGIVVGAQVVTGEQGVQSNLALGAAYSAFAGLCIALIVYNLALWRALRHRFQLYYCAMVACLLAYSLSSSGALAWLVPEIANNDRMRVNYLTLALALSSALFFARHFFEERVFAGWMGRYTRIYGGILLVLGPVTVLGTYISIIAFDILFTTLMSGILLVVAAMLWRAWRKRSDYLWLFALCWAAPIGAAAARVLGNLHVIPWSFWLDNLTIVAMAAEALTSSLAIAYRIKQLIRERDDAIASEILARRLADTDPLTGLLNRRAFLAQAIGREGEQQLLVADLDHFKRVNETLGHDGGDEVLRRFARLLRSVAPTSALVARLGGEEFAILTDGSQAIEPETVLARLRADRMPFDLQVTASMGTCRGPLLSEVDWKSLYRCADSALFKAKSAGRDRSRAA